MNNNKWSVALDDLLLDENQALWSRGFCFMVLSHQKYFNKQHIFIFFEMKIFFLFLHYPGFFKDHDPTSRTFQDFQGPWQNLWKWTSEGLTLHPSHIKFKMVAREQMRRWIKLTFDKEIFLYNLLIQYTLRLKLESGEQL